jgi:hypothetical protein
MGSGLFSTVVQDVGATAFFADSDDPFAAAETPIASAVTAAAPAKTSARETERGRLIMTLPFLAPVSPNSGGAYTRSAEIPPLNYNI